MIVINIKNPKSEVLSIVEKTGTENPDDPFNKILEISDMGSISINNMKWKFGNVEPISFLKTLDLDLEPQTSDQ